tara:strand:- start:317 stop:1609 length:1293 start_codon:yes stop_codon:yes gene_type:complete
MDEETIQIIKTVKETFISNKSKTDELSKVIDKYLIPQELEKKKNAEVSTPYKLRQEMLDKIPLSFWTEPHKVFEPCVGKGGFLIDIISRFMDGLKELIPDNQERYKKIVEECLYWCDINPTNVFICKLLIDPDNQYECIKYHEGDTLKLDIKEKWGIDGFDAVIGNPPYQNTNSNKGSGNILWNLFVEKSINSWVLSNKYLLFIHPRGWRQIKNNTGKLMMSRQIIYLNMNDLKQGISTFKCSTDFDYYLLQNKEVHKSTKINDYHNNEYYYMINNKLKFIPNHSLDKIFEMIDGTKDNGFMNDQSSYEPRKKWMSHSCDKDYKYPCIYSINSKNKASFKWSSRNDKGHYNITKFIFSNGNGYLKDINGDYGLTQWAYAFSCNKSDMNNIEKAFNSNLFKNIISATTLTSNRYNYSILRLFKKDFWKEFL